MVSLVSLVLHISSLLCRYVKNFVSGMQGNDSKYLQVSSCW